MARLSVLEPSVLHVPGGRCADDSWVIDFEQRWLDLIDCIKDSDSIGMEYVPLLTMQLESLMWDASTAPAWITDHKLRSRLMSVFFQRLRPAFLMVDEDLSSTATVSPRIDERDDDDPWLAATMALLDWAASMPDDMVIDVGCEGVEVDSAVVESVGGGSRTVQLVHRYQEFLLTLPLDELCRSVGSGRLSALLDLGTRRFEAENPGRERRYTVEFEPVFLKQFDQADPEMKVAILDAMIARVTQTQKSAMSDKGLKDEPFGDERRMRVTRAWRIHYAYVPGPGIRFLLVGPHDMALKR